MNSTRAMMTTRTASQTLSGNEVIENGIWNIFEILMQRKQLENETRT